MLDDEARNELTDRVYLHDEDDARPDLKEAFSLELVAMREPYSSLLDDFSGVPVTREQEEQLAFSERVSIRISRMEGVLWGMAGGCGKISVKGLEKNWEWITRNEGRMAGVYRRCEEMFASLPAGDPLIDLYVAISSRLWFHYVDYCEQCMALLACPAWGRDAERELLEEMNAHGSRYTATLCRDVFAMEDREEHLDEVRRSGKIVFPSGWAPHRS